MATAEIVIFDAANCSERLPKFSRDTLYTMNPGRSQLPSDNQLSVARSVPEPFKPSNASQDRISSSFENSEGELRFPFALSDMPRDVDNEREYFAFTSGGVEDADQMSADKDCLATANSWHQDIHSESGLALGTFCNPRNIMARF